jgi:hypothetical protein
MSYHFNREVTQAIRAYFEKKLPSDVLAMIKEFYELPKQIACRHRSLCDEKPCNYHRNCEEAWHVIYKQTKELIEHLGRHPKVNVRLGYGKHYDKSLNYVFACHRDYFDWLFNENVLTGMSKDLALCLKDWASMDLEGDRFLNL